MRNQWHRVPARAGRIAGAGMDGYAVTRLKNESVNGVMRGICRAGRFPMEETCRFNAKEG